jgi:hypothetical protein
MYKSGTFFHNNYLFIDKLIEMGIIAKDYKKEFPKLSSAIEEFYGLCTEYKYIQTYDISFVFYNRLVTDIPIVQKQPNVAGETKADLTGKIPSTKFGKP